MAPLANWHYVKRKKYISSKANTPFGHFNVKGGWELLPDVPLEYRLYLSMDKATFKIVHQVHVALTVFRVNVNGGATLNRFNHR